MQKREKEIEPSQRNCSATIMGIHTAYVFKKSEVKAKIHHMYTHMQTYWDSF